MKIAYIIYPEVIVSNRSNGIRSQAISWGESLKKIGVSVDYIDNWSNYDWTEYDAIHFFGSGDWVVPVARRIKKINSNIILSPIIDPPYNFSRIKAKIGIWLAGITGGRLLSRTYNCRFHYEPFEQILVRSEFEGNFISDMYNVRHEKIKKIPLSYSESCVEYKPIKKEPFCLHISSMTQDRKNVVRLIHAAKKFKFKLILAGNTGTKNDFKKIEKAIDGSPYIEVLGFISEEEKISIYKRAKVFALPSIEEGVGIVALDAAYYGCEIVITNIEGPKEYYNGNCIEVNPTDVDSIGKAVMKYLKNEVSYQPELSEIVLTEYSPLNISEKLLRLYKK